MTATTEEATETTPEATEVTEAPESAPETPEVEEPTKELEGETFSKEYVAKLRKEAAENRVRAKRADELGAALFIERVRATGKLADPTDLPVDLELLDDADALSEAIGTLLAKKPHLASRTPRGNVGQGSTGAGGNVDLAAMLRAGV